MSTEPLYSTPAPGALGTAVEDIPTLTLYKPAAPTGAAMVLCPGGGYRHLAAHEDRPFAEWLAGLGIATFSLHYRLGPKYQHPAMLHDVSRAIRTVRARAAEWKIDPKRIGVMGFSAGGHLASSVSVHHDPGQPASTDPVDRVSSRPDLSVLVYPVISMLDGVTHPGSQQTLLGPSATQELKHLMSSEMHVTPETPPAFIYHRTGDGAVPVLNPLHYAAALARAGVRFELHVYDHTGHGQGFAKNDPIDSDWTDRLQHWLKRQGF